MILEQLPAIWQNKCQEYGFTQSSPIQEAVFAPMSNQKNVVGISPTGSGKTLAYLWPSLLKVKPKEGLQLMIFTSSQELGIQVAEVAKDWGKDLQLNVQSLIGGANIKRQIERLKDKPEVIVGTPGRMLELMKQKKLKVHSANHLILDEADQLLQKGTIEFISEILRQVSNTTQFSFFSATAEVALPAIQKIVATNFELHDVSKIAQTNQQVAHYYLQYPKRQVVDALRRLSHIEDFQAFVFFNQLAELGVTEEKLLYHQVPVASLASDQSKELRRLALSKFKKQELKELLTTDLASRGLDLDKIPYVINMEVPMTKESYLHRAGRIGRMGATGTVVTIVQEHTIKDLKKLTRDLEISLQEVFLYEGQLTTTPKEKQQMTKEKKDVSPKATTRDSKLAFVKETGTSLKINSKKKSKNKQKNQKNKGARKKTRD